MAIISVIMEDSMENLNLSVEEDDELVFGVEVRDYRLRGLIYASLVNFLQINPEILIF